MAYAHSGAHRVPYMDSIVLADEKCEISESDAKMLRSLSEAASTEISDSEFKMLRSLSEVESTEEPWTPGPSPPMTPMSPLSPQLEDRSISSNTESIVSDHGAKAWEANTQAVMAHARSLGPKIGAQVVKTDSIELDPSFARAARECLQDKMASNSDLRHCLETQIRNVDGCTRDVKNALLFLKRALWTKWAPLCVVRKRLEIRGTRPIQERTHDCWQRAMEAEAETFAGARKELKEIINVTTGLLSPLERAKMAMIQDLNNKRRTDRIDHSCLLEGHGRGIAKAAECVFEPLEEAMQVKRPPHPVHDNAAEGAGVQNEAAWRGELEAFFDSVSCVIAITQEKLRANREAARMKERQCEQATALTVSTMHRHVKDLAASKAAIEEMIYGLERTAHLGDLHLQRTDKRMCQHALPLRKLSRQLFQRHQRCVEEHIRDEADERLDAHMQAVKSVVQALAPQIACTAELLADARATSEALQEALELKASALRIDIQCQKPKRSWIRTNVADEM